MLGALITLVLKPLKKIKIASLLYKKTERAKIVIECDTRLLDKNALSEIRRVRGKNK